MAPFDPTISDAPVLAFDAYGTLFDTGHGSVEATAKILARYPGCDVAPVDFYAVWKAHNLRLALEREQFETEASLFEIGLGLTFPEFGLAGDVGRDIGLLLATQGRRAPFADVAAALPRLARHARIVIASNSDTAPLLANVARAGLAFDAVVSSEELRVYKPDPRFYPRLLARLDVGADRVVFIGDTLEGDVLAPRRAGIESIWLRRPGVADPSPGKSEAAEAAEPVAGEPEPVATSLADVEQILLARFGLGRPK